MQTERMIKYTCPWILKTLLTIKLTKEIIKYFSCWRRKIMRNLISLGAVHKLRYLVKFWQDSLFNHYLRFGSLKFDHFKADFSSVCFISDLLYINIGNINAYIKNGWVFISFCFFLMMVTIAKAWLQIMNYNKKKQFLWGERVYWANMLIIFGISF